MRKSTKRKKRKRAVKYNRVQWTPHVEEDWIHSKIKGQGGGHRFSNPKGLVVIFYIGSTSKLKIFYYNIILWFKYLKRLIKGEI